MSLTAAAARAPTLQRYGNDANESTNCHFLFTLSSHSLHTLFSLSSHSLLTLFSLSSTLFSLSSTTRYGNDASESTNCHFLFTLSSHALSSHFLLTLFSLSSHSLPLSSTTRYGNDANESTDVATANPTIVATLKARLAAIEATEWDPPAPAANTGAACAVANGKYGGVIGPWQ
jgi:hypothetical protein